MSNTPPDPELSEESPPTDSRRRAVQTAVETFLRHVRRVVTRGSTDAAPTPVLMADGGQADAKVIGHNQGSGQTVGVWGEVDSSNGCGFATPDDVRIDGTVLTNETDFTVEAGTQSTEIAQNVVLGHASNTVAGPDGGAAGVTIAGGGKDDGSTDRSHVAYDNYGTIGGGYDNQVGASDDTNQPGGTVSGGRNNTASGQDATVGGGGGNTASGGEATVAGGFENTASGAQATVAGGLGSTASGRQATVAGGFGNIASGYRATVGGGDGNTASGTRAIIPGGYSNEASGTRSFAAGSNALATEEGSFVWNGSDEFTDVESPAPSTFSVQAGNGIWLGTDFNPSIGSDRFIDTSTGAYLTDGGVWTDSCSVTEKERFTPTDSIDVLEKVDSLEVSTWQYRDDDGGARHMGPTAEQFHDTFGLGDDAHHIAPLDTAGVALTAIQGLSTQLEQKADRIEKLEADRDELQDDLDAKDDRIERLEADRDELQDSLDAKDDRIERLEADRDELEAENDELRERLAGIEAHLGLDGASGPAPADD